MAKTAKSGFALGWAAAATLAFAAGCGGSGGGSDPEFGARELFVVDMDLDGLDGVALNTPLQIEFSDFVNPLSIRHDTVQIRLGPRLGIQSFGDFKVQGNIVTFFPRLPTKADLSDAGFQPQSDYRVSVEGYPRVDHVESYTFKPLVRTFIGAFSTAATTSPDLFTTDSYKDAPPPRVIATVPQDVLPVAPWTQPGGARDVPTDASIVMLMNRVPLLPSTVTTSNITLTMIDRLGTAQNRPIQGTPLVEQTFEGTTLRFAPSFPLADQARYVLRIENRVTDLTGAYDLADNQSRTDLRSQAESGGDPALLQFAIDNPEEVDPRTFLIFTTRDEPVKDLTLFLNFDGKDVDQNGGDGVDKSFTTADFNGAVKGAVAGVLTAAGGTGQLGDLVPVASTTLSTNSVQAVNGAFNYRTVDIPANTTVQVTGTIPGAILALNGMNIRAGAVVGATGSKGDDGEQSYPSPNSSLPLKAGGAGGPGGGKGGDCYTGTNTSGVYGGSGSPGSNGGGGGGAGGGTGTSAATGMAIGGGGGGGGHQYAGSAGTPGTYPSYTTWNGAGGAGGAAAGIQPTSALTDDGKTFYQKGVGGGGGGAGGPHFYQVNSSSINWRTSAAGGGGGGGAINLKSAGDIVISGQVVAKGGPGGNSATYYYDGGSGGGGGGGAVAIYANGRLIVAGARIDTAGGAGGNIYSGGYSGRGGSGGGGFVQLEDADGVIQGSTGAGAGTFIPDFYTGKFDPTGAATDAPSIFQSNWFNMGVFDPILQNFNAQDFLDQNFTGCSIKYEFQMCIEDSGNFGHANTTSINSATGVSSDLSKASQWATFREQVSGVVTSTDITGQMNGRGYQFFRVRISFTLKDGQKRVDPVPYVDRLRIRVKY